MVYLDDAYVQIAPEEYKSYQENVRNAHEYLHSGQMDMSGWVEQPQKINESYLKNILAAAENIRAQSTVLVVLGIGGSYLGPRAFLEWMEDEFQHTDKSPKIYFAGWNLSGTYHHELINKIMDEEISVCVISKSGTTMETAEAFLLLKEILIKKYGEDYSKRIYAITDPVSGALRKEAKEKGYVTFDLESDIGGRYSFLTAVGLLPACVAGYDIQKIVLGAQKAYQACMPQEIEQNAAYRYGVGRRILNERGKVIEVFCAYEPKMQHLLEWLKQLFGESEGKENKGIFPTSLVFSRDLHSMGQFLQEGTPVFFETVLSVATPQKDVSYDGAINTFNEQNELVRKGVLQAHSKGKTPVFTLTAGKMCEETFGYWTYFFEKACAMSCLLLGVDPFNQPGVEVYKAEVKKILTAK